MCVCVHAFVHARVHVHVCLRAYMHVCVCVHVHVLNCTYTSSSSASLPPVQSPGVHTTLPDTVSVCGSVQPIPGGWPV